MTRMDRATPADTRERYCVIGAGPSGLAMAAAFRRSGVSYDHVERHSRVGGIWDLENPGTPMYESAHFISSRTMSGFPDFPMPETFPDYPRREQILEYLRSYAAHHELTPQIEFGAHVSLVAVKDGRATVVINDQPRVYRGVVCASGVNWDPVLPDVPGTFTGEARHSQSYRSPQEFEGKRVLIVGLGNSGADIACDAARSAAQAVVSVRRGYYFIPKHIFGSPADVFAGTGPQLPLWLETPIFGLLQRILIGNTERLGMPKPDHKILQSHPLMNDQLLHHLRHGDVSIKPALARFEGRNVVFADGSTMEVDLVLFATGYSRRIPYLDAGLVEGDWAASNLLTCFSASYPNLFTLGFAELNGALYPHVGRLAQLVAHVCHLSQREPQRVAEFLQWMQGAKLELSGGRTLIDTPRHAHYCDDHALRDALKRAFKRLGERCP